MGRQKGRDIWSSDINSMRCSLGGSSYQIAVMLFELLTARILLKVAEMRILISRVWLPALNNLHHDGRSKKIIGSDSTTSVSGIWSALRGNTGMRLPANYFQTHE